MAIWNTEAAWLESNQLSDFMSAPIQQSQDVFDKNFTARQQHINHFVETAKAEGQSNYQRSAVIFAVVVVLAALLTSAALWWSRKMIVQPLAIVSSHFDSISEGNLARPIAVVGKNEISAILPASKRCRPRCVQP